jgi:hypothetical protein
MPICHCIEESLTDAPPKKLDSGYIYFPCGRCGGCYGSCGPPDDFEVDSFTMKPHTFELINRARKTNAAYDAIDRLNGKAPPGECGDLETFLCTVAAAIFAGMNRQDWNCVAEGWAMLDRYITDFGGPSLPEEETTNA